MGLAPGTVLPGGYVVNEPIGAGGIATVYSAKDEQGRPVAIKQLKAEFAHDQDAVKRFVREAYTANAIAHPGAVATLGHHESNPPFIVMELLDGDTLETRRAAAPGGRLTPAEVTAATLLVLDVLEAAHKKGIVHRDLKPENIFRTKDGKIKVIDFGLARVLEQNANEATMSGMLLGTASFMAPEQAQGMSQNVDARTDIWGLGATMFMLLTGHYVHDASNLAELLYRAARTEARSVRDALPSVPEPIAAIVDRALKYDPAHRYQDAATMASALRHASNDRSSVAFEATMIADPRAPASARPRVLPPPSTRSPSASPRSNPLPIPLSSDPSAKGSFDDLDAPTMVQTREAAGETFNFVADDGNEDSAVTRVLATSDNVASVRGNDLVPRRSSSASHKVQRPATPIPIVLQEPDDSSSTAVLPLTAAGPVISPSIPPSKPAPLPSIGIGGNAQPTMSAAAHGFQLPTNLVIPAQSESSGIGTKLLWLAVGGLTLVIFALSYLIFFH